MVDIETIIKAYKFCKNNEGTCDKCSYFHKKSKLFGCPINKDMISAISEQKAEIDRLKAEQPKVIRCKDCKFAYRKEPNLSNAYECRYPFSIIKENHYGDFFCANAEQKAGEQE